MTDSDAELLRAADTDPHAFRALYDRYASSVHGFFVRRGADHHAALDLTAETFARAWSGRGRFRDERHGSVGPWLFGIARNVLLHSVRDGRLADEARARLGIEAAASSGVVPLPEWLDGLDEEVEHALAALPEAQRAAIRRRVVDDCSYEVVAEDLGCTPATARLRVFRGLRTMRAELDAKGTR